MNPEAATGLLSRGGFLLGPTTYPVRLRTPISSATFARLALEKPMNHARPVTDAFGTRLDPDALVAGLSAQGLVDVRLVLEDGGFVVRHSGSDAASTMKALTWLRSVLSPLVPAR